MVLIWILESWFVDIFVLSVLVLQYPLRFSRPNCMRQRGVVHQGQGGDFLVWVPRITHSSWWGALQVSAVMHRSPSKPLTQSQFRDAGSGVRGGNLPSRALTLKQLKDVIADIYASKGRSDYRCALMIETCQTLTSWKADCSVKISFERDCNLISCSNV
jgi:hypothetical protein